MNDIRIGMMTSLSSIALNSLEKKKVKSIFNLYLQISTLIQHRSERPHATSERTLRAIGRVGQAVNLAVERFVTVGETIADDNPDIKQDMYDACKEARAAGENGKLLFNLLSKNERRKNRMMSQYVACLIKILETRCRFLALHTSL